MSAPTPEPPSPPRRYAKLLERALLAEARAERAERALREAANRNCRLCREDVPLTGQESPWEPGILLHEGEDGRCNSSAERAGSGRAALG